MLLILLSDFDYFLITFVIRPSTNVDFMWGFGTSRIFKSLLLRSVDTRNSLKKSTVVILFGLYLFGMFHITGAGTLYDAIRYGLDLNSNQINLIPFSSLCRFLAFDEMGAARMLYGF